MSLLPAGLGSLYLGILRLESLRLLFTCQYILKEGSLALLVCHPGGEEFGRSFDDCSNLGELRHIALSVIILLIMPLRVQD